MFCRKCGVALSGAGTFCIGCGHDQNGAAANAPPTTAYDLLSPAPPPRSDKAIGSLVCGFLFFLLPAAAGAILLGHLALAEIRRSGGKLSGRGAAIAGLVLGYSGLALLAGFIVTMVVIVAPKMERASAALSEQEPVSSIRAVNVAELTYVNYHKERGFTCSLEDLHRDHFIDGSLASGRRNGYIFELQGCKAESPNAPVTKYQIVAYPETVGPPGRNAYCSDQSDIIRVDAGGSAKNCLLNGKDRQ